MTNVNQTMNRATHNPEVREGGMNHSMEMQTGKIPSLGYLNLALASMAPSAATTLILGRRELGNFFGLWAPCFLLLGVYSKLVKIENELME